MAQNNAAWATEVISPVLFLAGRLEHVDLEEANEALNSCE
jgi:hypothetical protein